MMRCIRSLIVIVGLGLTSGCATTTTKEQRMETVLPQIEQQLADIEADLNRHEMSDHTRRALAELRERVRDQIGYIRVSLSLADSDQ